MSEQPQLIILSPAMAAEIRALIDAQLDERQSDSEPADMSLQAREIKDRLALIHAKEFLTINEAAYLLSCSPGHIRNLVKKAASKKTTRPIPLRNLDGVTVFNRCELLAWSAHADEPGKPRAVN